MNLNDLQVMNRTTGTIVIKSKKHQVFMLGFGMSEKDAKTLLKLLHIARTTKRRKTNFKQYVRVCKLMYKYGYVLNGIKNI